MPQTSEALQGGLVGRLVIGSAFCCERGDRLANEDYVGVAQSAGPRVEFAAAIADGVGGAKGGRVAAEISVRGFLEGYLGRPRHELPKDASIRSLEAINRWVHSIGRRDMMLAGMASTFTALVCEGRQVHIVHVGDSRLYRLRAGQLQQLTNDHSAGPGHLNVLTRAVGADDQVRIDYINLPSEQHDRYLLCTDGVYRGVSDDTLSAILNRRAAPEETVREIVDGAIAARTGDNATAMIMEVIDLPAPEFSDIEAALSEKAIRPLPQLGAVVDNFRIESVLSDSRYVRVFRAMDLGDSRPVVMKFPKPLDGADRPMRAAFLREMWIASRVRSPFVGEVLPLQDKRPTMLYLAMPLYEGEILESRLQRRPALSLATGLDIALKLAKGIVAMHRAGVIHRDIKPENVILCSPVPAQPAGVKLIDFGLAKLRSQGMQEVVAEPGTPSYMAPELFDGFPADEKSDQFALGVTIYRLFTGTYPYGEIEPFTRPKFGLPTRLSIHRPDLPSWLDKAVLRSMAHSPNDRYADALELIFELEHGADRASPYDIERKPFYHRNPLRFWKIACALLGLLVFVLFSIGKTDHTHSGSSRSSVGNETN